VNITVRQPGIQTTVQDRGRLASQHLGVPVGGAMDEQAHRIANLLVGNEADAAALECVLGNVALQFDAPALVALTGRDIVASLDGAPIAAWRAVRVHAGALLSLHDGCRTTIAIGGGIDVPNVLDARGTSLRAGFGGFRGRALQKQDVLAAGAPSPRTHRIAASLAAQSRASADWATSLSLRPRYSGAPTVRFLPGPEHAMLTDASRDALHADSFRLAADSDRMGFRFTGTPLSLTITRDMLSSGVTAGTIQLPPGGAPIILMADRQTTGGYPRLGEVIAVDLPLVAQLRPGDALRFASVTLDEAHALYRTRERDLATATRALHLRFATDGDCAR
jgi:antagonist of KipI